MGVAAGPAAILSLASMGFSAAGSLESAKGTASADQYKAAELDRAAQYGELKATQTNAQLTRNLSITLGNIDAVRAAARTDPTSPTGAAVRDFTEQTETERKNIQVDSILAQARQSEADAAYLRSASSDALLGGELGAGSALLKGVAGLIPGAPGQKAASGQKAA
jgi:hypothetical protein